MLIGLFWSVPNQIWQDRHFFITCCHYKALLASTAFRETAYNINAALLA